MIVVSVIADGTLVELDFGPYGKVAVPPEVALSFVSDEQVRSDIRKRAQECKRERRKALARTNGYSPTTHGHSTN